MPRAESSTYCLHTVPTYCLRGPPCLRLRLQYSLFLARDSRAHCNTTIHRSQGQDNTVLLPGRSICHIPREAASLRRNETKRAQAKPSNPPAGHIHTDTHDTWPPEAEHSILPPVKSHRKPENKRYGRCCAAQWHLIWSHDSSEGCSRTSDPGIALTGCRQTHPARKHHSV